LRFGLNFFVDKTLGGNHCGWQTACWRAMF
jgi:hypothetical protein